MAALTAGYPQAVWAEGYPVFLEDADLPSQIWAEDNPDGISVSVRLGLGTTVAPERIETALRSDFAEHGIRKVRFFCERGGAGGSSVVYATRNHVWGPFGLADSREQVREAAAQFRFELERGLN